MPRRRSERRQTDPLLREIKEMVSEVKGGLHTIFFVFDLDTTSEMSLQKSVERARDNMRFVSSLRAGVAGRKKQAADLTFKGAWLALGGLILAGFRLLYNHGASN